MTFWPEFDTDQFCPFLLLQPHWPQGEFFNELCPVTILHHLWSIEDWQQKSRLIKMCVKSFLFGPRTGYGKHKNVWKFDNIYMCILWHWADSPWAIISLENLCWYNSKSNAKSRNVAIEAWFIYLQNNWRLKFVKL